MESLSQAALQNGLATLDDLARVTLTESPAEKIHILKESAERMRQQQQESNKAQIEAQERKDQREYQMHKEKLDNEIEIALINAEVKDRDSERKTDSQDLELNKQEHRDKIELEREKVRLEREKLQETRRTNLAKESIARAKSSQQK
jgi:hypothetical protein